MRINKILLLCLLITRAGCQYGMILMTNPRQMVEAKYKLEKGKKIAILVDDYMSPIDSPGMKAELARKIGAGLVEAGAIRPADLVSTQAIEQTPKDTSDNKKLSIQHIGKELQADYVLYVNITDFKLQAEADNPLIQPRATANVKVIEVQTGERLWPVDAAGEPIEAKGKMEGELTTENSDNSKYSEQLTDLLAAKIMELFFSHRETD